MSKRQFTVVAHLNPKRKGRVIALPMSPKEKGPRTLATLAEVTRTAQGLDPEDLYAVFKVESIKLPPIKVMGETDTRPIEVKELQAWLTLYEMDFGKEDGEDVELAHWSSGKLVKKKGSRWEFQFSDYDLEDVPYSGDHVTYFRIVSATQPDKYVLVPIDPEKVGYLTKKEGKHYEVAFKVSIYDPGYEAGPGEDSGKQVERGTLLDAPAWWEEYKNGKKQRPSGQKALPTLRVQYNDFKPVDDEALRGKLTDYVRQLESRINQHWDRMSGVVQFFGVKADKYLEGDKKPAPSFWSVLKGAYTIASLALPALRGLGVVIEVIEAFKLSEVEVDGKTVLGTKDQAKSAVDDLMAFGKATITFAQDLDGFLSAARGSPGEDAPQLRVSEFIQRAIEKGLLIRQQQEDAAKALEQAVRASIPSLGEVEKRDLYDDLESKYEQLLEDKLPGAHEMLSKLLVEFMNAYGIGVFTWTNDAKEGPPSHSHIAGPNRNLEEHAFYCLREAFGGKLAKESRLHVTKDLQKKYLPGLKSFGEKLGQRMMLLHYSDNPGIIKTPDDTGSDHYIHQDHFEDRALPSVTWSYGYKYFYAYYKAEYFR